MGTDVAKANPFGTALTMKDTASLAARAQEAAQNNPRGGGAPHGSEYLNFSGKSGRYKLGERTVRDDEMFLVNVQSFEEGWVCWKEGKPKANRMANIYTDAKVPTPDFEEFGPFNVDKDKGEGWYQAKAFVLKSLDHDDQGYLKLNSKSGVSAMAGLMGDFSQRAMSGLPAWPVITLDTDEFTAQGFTNFAPVFKVYGWLDDAGVAKLGENPDADIDDLIAQADPDVAGKVSNDGDKDDEKPAARTGGRRRR